MPLNLVNAGLGSKVSTWLGPPFMKRKTQCLALAGKCGGLGARGEVAALALSAKNPPAANKSISASPAKPPPTCHKNSRRDWPHGVGLGMKRLIHLLRVNEFIQIQNHPAHLLQRGLLCVCI